MGAWHHLNTDQTGYWVDPEEHMENLLKRPQNLYDRMPGESGEEMFERKGRESMASRLKRTHGSGLYDSIVKRGEKIEQPITMEWNDRMTSPRLLDGYHRSKVALIAQQQTGRQVRLPVEYVKTGGISSGEHLSAGAIPASHVPLEQSYATGIQSYEDRED